MKILVVDDSKPIHMMVNEMLTRAGHVVTIAENGQEAIDAILSSGKENFELILLDWNMPVMDGPSFLRKFQEMENDNTTVMMMTTEGSMDHIKKAFELGATEYIIKPFTSDILISKIELALRS